MPIYSPTDTCKTSHSVPSATHSSRQTHLDDLDFVLRGHAVEDSDVIDHLLQQMVVPPVHLVTADH